MTDGRAAPQNLEAEEHVLGAMMTAPSAVEAVVELGIKARDFYLESHGLIFDAAVALYVLDRPVDAITLTDKLTERDKIGAVGGRVRLHELANLVPASANASHYARIVKENSVLRQFIRAGGEIARLGWERPGELPDLIDKAERAIFDLALTGHTSDFVPFSEAIGDAFRRIEELSQKSSDIIGVPSGYRTLDKITSGFQPGNLVIVAARPSMGKSALALGASAHVALAQQKPVGLFTLEMSQFEVTQRILSAEAYVESGKIRNGSLDRDEWGRLTAAAGRLENAPLYIDDSGTTTAVELRAKARRLKMRHPSLAMIVVDYIQLMTSGGSFESRQNEVSQISRGLKTLARDLDVPVIALSQLSRAPEGRHDKRPILSDLRESGALEQDADVVIFLYRDEYYHPEDTDQEGLAEVNVAKQRNGPTEMVKLAFVKRHTRFSDLAAGAGA